MKLLWLSHFIPFPPRGGNVQRSYNLMRQMSSSFEISLVALNLLGERPEQVHTYIQEMKRFCRNVEIWELPYPWKGARWRAELLCSPFFRLPFSCRAVVSKRNLLRWQQVLRDHTGALLHVDSIDLARFAGAGNGLRKVLNHHNCESALAYRRAQKESNPLARAYLWLQARKLAQLERSICGHFSVNIVVSEEDLHLLRSNQPHAHIHVVENGVDTHYFVPASLPSRTPSLVFTGSLDWQPNLSAMGFLVREIWPQVKRNCHGVRLYLAGKNPPESVLRWSEQDDDIVVVANPEDMRPLLAQATVYVCPLLEGGGTRLKILDAMAMAKPIVSTTIGCEGLRVKHGENILVGDGPSDFVHRVVELLENEALRNQLGTAGRALVEREYSWERIAHQLERAYRCALQPEVCDQRAQEVIAGLASSQTRERHASQAMGRMESS